jgi:hypothetical protein
MGTAKMNLSDKDLEAYVDKKLALPGNDRNELRQQVKGSKSCGSRVKG